MIRDHHRFRETLDDEISRSIAFSRPFSLLMLRSANPLGDSLEFSVQRLAVELRPFDRIALYESDIIEVLLPEIDENGAHRIAEELIERSRELDDGSLLLLCGLSTFPRGGDSAEALIDACRLALHGASVNQPIGQATRTRSTAPWPHQILARSDLIVTENPKMREVYDAISRLAYATIPVLIHGETGSGKEVVARALHQRGPRASKRLVSLNCGAIPSTLLESMLFGHERGSFTGAIQQSLGVFEQAHGGSVLLDEIGELTPAAQVALLRAIETKHIRRIGAANETAVDVRVIAATHRDLDQMCRQGRFRWDLYYRLSGFVLHIPPLRARPEDILPLAQLFVQRAASDHYVSPPVLDQAVIERLHAFDWPGNIRELRNAIEHAVVLSTNGRITIHDLPQKLIELQETIAPSTPVAPQGEYQKQPDPPQRSSSGLLEQELKPNLRSAVRHYEARLIVEALGEARGNRTQTAKRLGISVRTLTNKMNALGIKKLGFAIVEHAER